MERQMQINVQVPILITPFAAHAGLKDEILKNIVGEEYLQVSKTDWNLPRDVERPYIQTIQAPLLLQMKAAYATIGYKAFNITNIWVQQYEQNSTHQWHLHESCHYTNIYYVELPEGCPCTEFISPATGETFTVPAVEGDIVSIPSIFIHRSPPNQSTKRKTIISFNTDFYVR